MQTSNLSTLRHRYPNNFCFRCKVVSSAALLRLQETRSARVCMEAPPNGVWVVLEDDMAETTASAHPAAEAPAAAAAETALAVVPAAAEIMQRCPLPVCCWCQWNLPFADHDNYDKACDKYEEKVTALGESDMEPLVQVQMGQMLNCQMYDLEHDLFKKGLLKVGDKLWPMTSFRMVPPEGIVSQHGFGRPPPAPPGDHAAAASSASSAAPGAAAAADDDDASSGGAAKKKKKKKAKPYTLADFEASTPEEWAAWDASCNAPRAAWDNRLWYDFQVEVDGGTYRSYPEPARGKLMESYFTPGSRSVTVDVNMENANYAAGTIHQYVVFWTWGNEGVQFSRVTQKGRKVVLVPRETQP